MSKSYTVEINVSVTPDYVKRLSYEPPYVDHYDRYEVPLSALKKFLEDMKLAVENLSPDMLGTPLEDRDGLCVHHNTAGDAL